jgi:hypothetical protein
MQAPAMVSIPLSELPLPVDAELTLDQQDNEALP